MNKSKMFNLNKCFKNIFIALREEDKNLLLYSKTLNNKNGNFKKDGISNFYEKNLHYIIYKALISIGDYLVYMEENYKNCKGKCDITLDTLGEKKTLWLEIKLIGPKKNWININGYKRWLKNDIKKLKKLPKDENHKYYLLTWAEKGKPNKFKWKTRLEKNLVGIKFIPSLFNFFKTTFYDYEKKEGIKDGYYVVCLLKVL